jgi:hypothetical protein
MVSPDSRPHRKKRAEVGVIGTGEGLKGNYRGGGGYFPPVSPLHPGAGAMACKYTLVQDSLEGVHIGLEL